MVAHWPWDETKGLPMIAFSLRPFVAAKHQENLASVQFCRNTANTEYLHTHALRTSRRRQCHRQSTIEIGECQPKGCRRAAFGSDRTVFSRTTMLRVDHVISNLRVVALSHRLAPRASARRACRIYARLSVKSCVSPFHNWTLFLTRLSLQCGSARKTRSTPF